MAYHLCISCDICNQDGFIQTSAESRRKRDGNGGRRHSDGRQSLRIKSDDLQELLNLLSQPKLLAKYVQGNQWQLKNGELHFCSNCYNKHPKEINTIKLSKGQFSVHILHSNRQ